MNYLAEGGPGLGGGQSPKVSAKRRHSAAAGAAGTAGKRGRK